MPVWCQNDLERNSMDHWDQLSKYLQTAANANGGVIGNLTSSFIWTLASFLCHMAIRVTTLSCGGNNGEKTKHSEIQQYFRVRPQDLEVKEGQTLELPCQIGHLAGEVQWSKDGFLLGFDPEIPGYPRYRMMMDVVQGTYSLQIENVQLEDEGEYQCQVGPGHNQQPIRALARLTVLVPPKHVSINNLEDGDEAMVREGEKLTLTCTARGSKPSSELKWYRRYIELLPEAAKLSVRREQNKRYTTSSTIHLYPKLENSGITYTCEAHHQALLQPIRTTVAVGVLYPPGIPKIQGYKEGDIVHVGEKLSLVCISRGGRPTPKILWYRNEEIVDITYSTSGQESTNTYMFTAAADDNRAVYRCEAINSDVMPAMVATVKLKVLFPPTKLNVSGPTEATRGETISLFCQSDLSNPPAQMSWVVDGSQVKGGETETIQVEDGWLTSSNLTVTITRQDPNLKSFECLAVGLPLKAPVVRKHEVTVKYPPNPPIIQGYEEDTPINEGHLQRLVCLCNGGNPLPTLVWYREDKELTSFVTISGNDVSSEVVFRAEAKDNGAIYMCQAKNSATIIPLEAFVRITVYFPPENVTVSCAPVFPRESHPVTVICTTASSNPASKISWWKNSELISDFPEETINASYGGVATRSELSFIVKYEDDGALFTCHARNYIFSSYVEDKMALGILYKPRFREFMPVVDIIEGDSTEISLYAEGNPEALWFTWSKEGNVVPTKSNRDRSADDMRRQRPTVTNRGSILEINLVSRHDAGAYVCEAENEEGISNATVVLNVLYPATVTNISEYLEVKEGNDAYLECAVDGNPLTDNMITWKRKGSDTTLVHHMISSRRSYFTIINVSKNDGGHYYCIADNGIGGSSSLSSTLVVKYRPVIHRDVIKDKVACELGDTTRLICLAEGYPKIDFEWNFKENNVDIRGDSSKYAIRLKEMGNGRLESTLFIKDIEDEDFGTYECTARNAIGHETNIYKLLKKDVPETPRDIRIVNVSHDSTVIKWIPGYNGGMEQIYKIRYLEVDSDDISYLEVTGDKNMFQVDALKAGTDYKFSVAAINELGSSNFSEEVIVATARLPIMDTTLSKNENTTAFPYWWWIAASVIGGIAGIVNVVIVCILRRRCTRRRSPDGIETTSNSEQCSRENVDNKIKCNADGQAYFLSGSMYGVRVESIPLQKYQVVNTLDEPGGSYSPQKRYYDSFDWSDEGILERMATRRRFIDPHKEEDYPDILKRSKYETTLKQTTESDQSNNELSPKTSLTMNIRCLATSTRSLDSESCIGDNSNKDTVSVSRNNMNSRSSCDVRMRKLLFDSTGRNTEHYLTEETLIS